jgi:hypothetical protein
MRGVEAQAASERRVVVVFDGGATEDLTVAVPPQPEWMRAALAALPDTTGGASGDVLVVRTAYRGSHPDAGLLLQRIARAVFVEEHSAHETLPMPVQTLAAWSRPPGTSQPSPPGDEGDRRWLWATALVLMGAEMVVRRRRSAPADRDEEQEARVA